MRPRSGTDGTAPARLPRHAGATSRRDPPWALPAGARPLARRFYARPPGSVARALLGRVIVRDTPHGRVVGRIVEVEAYGGRQDPASHGFRGETARNRTMFGPPGHAYVYLSYGVHHCLNVVTGKAGRSSAVLIRSLEPLAGLDLMARRRGLTDPDRLARGPGCVAQALGLTRAHAGMDLTRPPLWLADLPPRRGGRRIARTPRIGITRAAERPWRFLLAGHPCVSGGPLRPRPGGRRVRR